MQVNVDVPINRKQAEEKLTIDKTSLLAPFLKD